MPSVKKSAKVTYSQRQMFDLVNDVAAYPEFLPWCSESKILSQSEDEISASLTLSHSGFDKTFTTQNRLQPHKMMEIRLKKGPFKRLQGFWLFDELPNDECCVRLDMEFEFSNKLIGMMFGPVFHKAVNMLVDAFVERADVVYGKKLS